MASPPLSEDERRLLREYRLTTIPTRRYSCSDQQSREQKQQQRQQIALEATPTTPTTSNISSPVAVSNSETPTPITTPVVSPTTVSTTTTVPTTIVATTTTITTTIAAATTTTASPSPSATTTTSTSTSTSTNTPATVSKSAFTTTNNSSHNSSNTNGNNNSQQHGHHHHHHGHHHHNHHHHHHSKQHHKQHKPSIPTHELTPDELNQMLGLVSELNYLKLVSPVSGNNNSSNNLNKTMANGSATKATEGVNSKLIESNGKVMKPKSHSESFNNNNNLLNVDKTNSRLTGIMMNTSLSNAKNSCEPYIFEKVDYIKKISIRRKAIRKLKKARNKSCGISPNTKSESPKLKS